MGQSNRRGVSGAQLTQAFYNNFFDQTQVKHAVYINHAAPYNLNPYLFLSLIPPSTIMCGIFACYRYATANSIHPIVSPPLPLAITLVRD